MRIQEFHVVPASVKVTWTAMPQPGRRASPRAAAADGSTDQAASSSAPVVPQGTRLAFVAGDDAAHAGGGVDDVGAEWPAGSRDGDPVGDLGLA
ncbi:hypothetical protein [Nocardiopsis sp. YSL2]|uniref:hypothetical protein n=1 Tax=Nocardiopsis sp. YSL2 TaxID=2939492 RepID=UPI0026F413C2|nr:hypothetical protein [Nocardiopsis sp. YSL2]